MAMAKKCDVCGEFYIPYNFEYSKDKPNGIQFLNIANDGAYYSHDKLDCCPKCMNAIRLYLDNLKNVLENSDENS